LAAREISPSDDTKNELTKVHYGTQNVLDSELQFFSNSNEKIDSCMNYTRPQLAIEIEQIKNAFIDAKNRGVSLRYITEITSENISFCKELIKIVSELRHLDGIKGNFMVSEREYLAPLILFRKGEIAQQLIYSNIKEVIEHQQYVFDTLWMKAVSVTKKIKEIEEGIEPIRTRLLENQDEIIREIKRQNRAANQLSICTEIGGMQMSYNYLFDSYKTVVDKHGKGESKEGLRWLTNIDDKESANLIQLFLQSEMQVRHIKNMPPLNFGVSDKEVAITVEKMEGGKMSQKFLLSNEPLYVSHFNSIFEELWRNGVDAAGRIRDIEAGVDLADIEVIPSSKRAQEIYSNIVKSAAEEILWIFPTTNAFIRQEKTGDIQLAKQAAKERNVKVRILVPANSLIEQKVQKLKENCSDRIIDVRYIEQMTQTKATILVVDRKASLVMELRDDSKTTFVEAIGLSTYSNSKAGVLSYVAIFDNLWKQTELYEQLKINDKMQKEFINIAAHELRTPIQPILSLSQILQSNINNSAQQQEFLDAIVRNARRLQRLTENILDVSKIESQSLQLKKERFSLNEKIRNVINGVNNQGGFRNNNSNVVPILFEPKEDVLVEADKVRIYEVISNLLKNAIQFTKEGTITIAAEEKVDYNEIQVSVKDTGIGIDPEILPRLFTKFASKSVTGTGLGLFISKAIVEAHGGKIWAQNNTDGKGATFAFSLPLSK
jgi:two-component system sensor histidine kinase VicK